MNSQPFIARLLEEADEREGGRGAARLPLQLLPDSFVDPLHASHAANLTDHPWKLDDLFA